MTRLFALLFLTCTTMAAQSQPAAKWWAHIEMLANDTMNGRDTGSPEHRKAAEYIAAEFKKAGLEPGGTNGYFQPIRFRSRRIVEAKSSLQLVRAGGVVENVELGEEATFSMRIEPAPSVEAPIVFVGYGLQVPESKHDDLAGLDLKGKIVLLLTGGPSNIPGPLLAHYQSIRWEYLKKAGAIGVFAIQNPKGQDIPWDRSKLSRFMPALAIADPALDETLGQQTAVTINPANAERFFTGSGHTFKELLALSNDGKALPRFAIPATARVTVAIDAKTIDSDNVIGILRGSDPELRAEYVVVSAHLDHVGVGEPINGDRIYNGAMDNASGIATLIETAAGAAARGGLKRSIVFAAVTAEEKGLLGSRYFANRPTVAPAGALVEGGLRQELSGARDRPQVAHRAVPRAERRPCSTNRSPGGRGFREGLSGSGSSRRQSPDPAAVEQREFLQTLCEIKQKQEARRSGGADIIHSDPDVPHPRHAPRCLRSHGPDRRRRHGRSLSCARHEARSGCGDQGSAADTGGGSRTPRAV
ncbi:MAG: M28 family metallopeptidase [Acidobacteriota bacterium]|nr:M28 family metallopeptidase [Acidobacteriota bacterium]